MSNEYLDCYTRVSTTIQETDGNSLEVQESLGKKVSKKLGLKFRHHQEGSRSSTRHYRDVLEDLKDDMKSGKVKNIWIQDRSRLFRDMTDGLLFRRDYLERYKVTLYEGELPTKLDLDNEDEKVMYDIITRLQEYENKKRSEKSQRGKIYKLQKYGSNSVYLGGTSLFGYENIDKKWVINKDESKWVKFIFDSYEKGKTTQQIKDSLDKQDIPPRRTSNGLWNLGTLQKMLRNESYTGVHRVHIKKLEKDFDIKVPKIINVGQFRRVQKLMDSNIKNKSNNKQHYSLLEGLVVCECGRPMGSRHLKSTSSLGYKVNTRSYYCLSKNYDWKSGDKSVCRNTKSLQMDSLNEYVLGFVKDTVGKSYILKEKFKNEILDKKFQRMKDIKETEKKLEQRIQRLQGDIESIENNIVELEVDVGLGKKEKSIVDKIIKRYGEELENRRTRYKETEKEIDDLGQDRNWLDWVSRYGESIEIPTLMEKQKEYLQGVISKIVIKGEHGLNRDGKEVQVGHSVWFHFKMKIVDDGLEVDNSTKPRTYKVLDGKKIDHSDGVMRFVSKRNRTKKKRKQGV